ncbi:hypothetical protein [Rhizobium leguminosarum]|uniref:hypothetical protein n=1 Tax=Rhizobium leguminosarum TaxID=384 RepID=UPI0010327A3E|nr:hypothetical protein [Rhizobium leguminosarum]TAY13746.1 hypothetical protein ELH96_19195 [Rhizobium leguminosarum]
MQNDDFALLAVIDAYKWWISSDYGFLRLTGAIDDQGNPSEPGVSAICNTSLRRIAQAYSVSRNIPSDELDSQAQQVVDLFMKSPPPEIDSVDLLTRAKALAALSKKTPMLVTLKNGGQSERQLASALSKLSWFIHPQGWTIFDKYVGAAVIGQDGSGLAQMSAFYQKLAPSWEASWVAVCSTADRAGFHPFLGYRIIDKYLYCHGLGMYREPGQGRKTFKLIAASTLEEKLSRPAVEEHRLSLNWTLEAFGDPVAENLRNLADLVGKTLSELPVFQAAIR